MDRLAGEIQRQYSPPAKKLWLPYHDGAFYNQNGEVVHDYDHLLEGMGDAERGAVIIEGNKPLIRLIVSYAAAPKGPERE